MNKKIALRYKTMANAADKLIVRADEQKALAIKHQYDVNSSEFFKALDDAHNSLDKHRRIEQGLVRRTINSMSGKDPGYTDVVNPTVQTKQSEYNMDLYDKFIERLKTAAAMATNKPAKATPAAKPVAKPVSKPASKPSATSSTGKPGAAGASGPVKPFEGTQFTAALKTKEDQTNVTVKTTREGNALGFKDLARTFVDKVKI
jgi:hypothetical protein